MASVVGGRDWLERLGQLVELRPVLARDGSEEAVQAHRLHRGSRLGPGQLLMHPGPVNRGIELSADAIDSPQALIGEQVKAGVAVRMAVLYLCAGGQPELVMQSE